MVFLIPDVLARTGARERSAQFYEAAAVAVYAAIMILLIAAAPLLVN
jgi:xanthine/uracil/vitamin C permease (AzgA family)